MTLLADRQVQSRPSTHRVIEDLRSAHLSTEEPWKRPKNLKGSRGKGLTYQRRVERELKRRFSFCARDLFIGQWLAFLDGNGRGFAQPDAYLVGPHSIVVFEVKLTQHPNGLQQIHQLYRPLLGFIYEKPVTGILICRNLVTSPGRWGISDPELVLDDTSGNTYTWHWLDHGSS